MFEQIDYSFIFDELPYLIGSLADLEYFTPSQCYIFEFISANSLEFLQVLKQFLDSFNRSAKWMSCVLRAFDRYALPIIDQHTKQNLYFHKEDNPQLEQIWKYFENQLIGADNVQDKLPILTLNLELQSQQFYLGKRFTLLFVIINRSRVEHAMFAKIHQVISQHIFHFNINGNSEVISSNSNNYQKQTFNNNNNNMKNDHKNLEKDNQQCTPNQTAYHYLKYKQPKHKLLSDSSEQYLRFIKNSNMNLVHYSKDQSPREASGQTKNFNKSNGTPLQQVKISEGQFEQKENAILESSKKLQITKAPRRSLSEEKRMSALRNKKHIRQETSCDSIVSPNLPKQINNHKNNNNLQGVLQENPKLTVFEVMESTLSKPHRLFTISLVPQ